MSKISLPIVFTQIYRYFMYIGMWSCFKANNYSKYQTWINIEYLSFNIEYQILNSGCFVEWNIELQVHWIFESPSGLKVHASNKFKCKNFSADELLGSFEILNVQHLMRNIQHSFFLLMKSQKMLLRLNFILNIECFPQVAQLLETLKSQNIALDDKEARRLDRASTDGKIPRFMMTTMTCLKIPNDDFRADFVDYAKGSRAVKALLEKEGRPATPGSNRFRRCCCFHCCFDVPWKGRLHLDPTGFMRMAGLHNYHYHWHHNHHRCCHCFHFCFHCCCHCVNHCGNHCDNNCSNHCNALW